MNKVELPLTVSVDGREWKLHSMSYQTADGKFNSYFYALSMEHAACIVEEIRESAALDGEIVGVV